jgi:hypothetical protein
MANSSQTSKCHTEGGLSDHPSENPGRRVPTSFPVTTWYKTNEGRADSAPQLSLESLFALSMTGAESWVLHRKKDSFSQTVSEVLVNHRGGWRHSRKAHSMVARKENECLHLLAFPFLFNLGPQPMGWCHPYSGRTSNLTNAPSLLVFLNLIRLTIKRNHH